MKESEEVRMQCLKIASEVLPLSFTADHTPAEVAEEVLLMADKMLKFVTQNK